MKSTSFILCGLLALSGIAAQAGEPSAPEQYSSPTAATLTRAEVKQATLRAIANGEVSFGDVDLHVDVAGETGRTRAEVKEEVLHASAAHELRFGDVDLPQAATLGAGRSWAGMRAKYLARARPRTSDQYTTHD